MNSSARSRSRSTRNAFFLDGVGAWTDSTAGVSAETATSSAVSSAATGSGLGPRSGEVPARAPVEGAGSAGDDGSGGSAPVFFFDFRI